MNSDRCDTRVELELICADFECAWRSGWRPRIEDFLIGLAEPRRSALLAELMRVELRNREALGETPTPQEYEARFPYALSVVDGVFNGTRHSFKATTAGNSDGISSPRALDRDRFATNDPLPRRNFDETPTAASISWADNEPQAGVLFYLGSRKNAEAPSTTISLSHGGSPLPSNEEWGIERYTRLRKLGEGTFGEVYLATDRELNRKVAVKLPTRSRPTTEQDATNFLVEARTLATLDHSGIVPVYDVGRAPDGRCYVVSKYIRGEDLKQRLSRRNRLTQKEAAELVRQVASALHHAHGSGLVHRDIKPANILLSEQDVAYVADFGLALKTEDVQLAGGSGTPAYMSPEQITSDVAHLDGRSDIFSLGVVLYELLTGERPFRGKSLVDLLTAICSYDPSTQHLYRFGVSRTLVTICLKCLAKRPADRFQTGQQLADELQRWLTTGETAPAPAPAPSSRPMAFASTLVLGAVVGLIALVAAIVIGFLIDSRMTSSPSNLNAPPARRLPGSIGYANEVRFGRPGFR
jgi:serine/threonine protein kinase